MLRQTDLGLMQKAFDVDSGYATLGGSHTGLAIVGIAYVAGGENTGNVGGA